MMLLSCFKLCVYLNSSLMQVRASSFLFRWNRKVVSVTMRFILLNIVDEQTRTKDCTVLCQMSWTSQYLVLYLCPMGYTVSVYLCALKGCLGTSIQCLYLSAAKNRSI